MEVRKSKQNVYKKAMTNNFMNQYYHSTSAHNEDSNITPAAKAV